MITLKTIAALSKGSTVWDEGKGAVTGFGARRQKGYAVAYVLKYRTVDGRQRWATIGRHGAPWTTEAARDQARRLLGEVVNGADPAGAKLEARKAATVSDLCNDYLDGCKAGRVLTRQKTSKKASTLDGDRGRIERHIKPLLGTRKVASVTQADIEHFRDAVSEGATAARIKTGKHGVARITGGRGTATRALGMLGAVFAYAVRCGLRADNPVRGVVRHADGQRERRMSEGEYAALGAALKAMPATTWKVAIAATKFLALTGWRRGEMLSLKWSELDLETRTARLVDTKTGSSTRPLSYAACDVLRELPRLGKLVFPASEGTDKTMSGYHKVWLRVAKEAALGSDITPHVLRHSFASVAADLEFSELTIAALIGHKKASMTSRYTHKADAVLLQAADAVANTVAEQMGDARETGIIVELPRRAAG